MKTFAGLIIPLISTLGLTEAASAQALVLGGGSAQECYQKTKFGDPGRLSSVKICEKALDEDFLNKKDRAATHINTAILYMRSGKYDDAARHYKESITAMPNLPEAYISYSANFIYQGNYTRALELVNKGIDLGTDKMPEALYNRSIAYDRMKNYKLAYKDLKRALELRPDWEPASKAIEKYVVVKNG